MFKNYKHYVGQDTDDLVFGYTKRVDGYSPYPDKAFNMALYVSDKEKNVHKHQELLAREIQFDTSKWVIPNQRHGRNVVKITRQDLGKNVKTISDDLMDVDGLYTYERDILLAMNFADCTPLYLYSTKNDFIALLHAGWKGTKLNILNELLGKYRGPIEDLRLIIGVAINKKSYEVDDNVVNDTWDIPKSAIERRGDKYLFDLKEINRYQALKCGLNESQIHVTEYGTEMKEFFSYRLEKGQTGRALAFIGRRSKDD